MFPVAFVTVGLAFLIISFLAFAFPHRYVRLANLYFGKTGSDRRLQLRTYQRWSYRISNLVLFLMLLLCFCWYFLTIIHR